jgi:hypothetical protein
MRGAEKRFSSVLTGPMHRGLTPLMHAAGVVGNYSRRLFFFFDGRQRLALLPGAKKLHAQLRRLEALREARALLAGGMSLRRAALSLMVPKTTLSRWMKGSREKAAPSGVINRRRGDCSTDRNRMV